MIKYSLLVALIIFTAAPNYASEIETPLKNWEFIGDGFTASVGDAFLLSEYPGSSGVMLVSPHGYGKKVEVRFSVMPLNPETVVVAMLSATDAGQDTALTFPRNYDGNIMHLLGQVDSYFFAFHNAAHNRTPFVRKHPYIKGESEDFDVFETNIMSTRWHRIELIADNQGVLKMKIDGKSVLSAIDENPLPGGKVLLRLRGTKTHTATALIKDLEIVND